MIFLFRADCNSTIASGHIMRCISIANEIKRKGFEVLFITADDNPATMLDNAGINYISLGNDWRNLMVEVPKLIPILEKHPSSYLIVDSYNATFEYINSLLPYANVCYLGSKKEYLGKIYALINYSADIDYDFYESNYAPHTKLLLGPRYAPLRSEFSDIKSHFSGKLNNVLLTTGNTDNRFIVDKILNIVANLEFCKEIEFHVVIGSMFNNVEHLISSYSDYSNIIMHQYVTNIAELMRNSDLAITANGTTVYELVVSKVPVVSFAMVQEQIKSAEALSKIGAIDYIGNSFDDENLFLEKVIDRLNIYYKNPSKLNDRIKKASGVINGDGSKRIIEEILNSNI